MKAFDDVSIASRASLPSLVSLPRMRKLGAMEFIRSIPVTRRGLYVCFGDDEHEDVDPTRIMISDRTTEVYPNNDTRQVIVKPKKKKKVKIDSEGTIRKPREKSSQAKQKYMNSSAYEINAAEPDMQFHEDSSKVFFFSEQEKALKIAGIFCGNASF